MLSADAAAFSPGGSQRSGRGGAPTGSSFGRDPSGSFVKLGAGSPEEQRNERLLEAQLAMRNRLSDDPVDNSLQVLENLSYLNLRKEKGGQSGADFFTAQGGGNRANTQLQLIARLRDKIYKAEDDPSSVSGSVSDLSSRDPTREVDQLLLDYQQAPHRKIKIQLSDKKRPRTTNLTLYLSFTLATACCFAFSLLADADRDRTRLLSLAPKVLVVVRPDHRSGAFLVPKNPSLILIS